MAPSSAPAEPSSGKGAPSAPEGEDEAIDPMAAGELDERAEADVTRAAVDLSRGRYGEPPKGRWPSRFTAPTSSRVPRVEEKTADRWTLRLPDPLPVPTPAVHQDRIVVGTGLWFGAFDRSGELMWGRKTTDMSPTNAACENGLCAFSTYSCTVVVAEVDTGKVRADVWLGPTLLSAPSVAHGVIYAAFETGRSRPNATGDIATAGLVALELSSGKERWRRWIDRDALGAPVIDGEQVHVASWGGTLFSLDRDSGAVRSAHARYAAGPPSVAGDMLHYTQLRRSGSGWETVLLRASNANRPRSDEAPPRPRRLLARRPAPRGSRQVRELYPDARPGATWPPADLPQWPTSSVASRSQASPYSQIHLFTGWSPVQAGATLVGVLGNEIVALRDGEVKWSRDLSATYDAPRLAKFMKDGIYYMATLGGYPAAALSASRDRVVAVTLDGRALVLDAETGALHQSLDVGHVVTTQAVLDRGWIYVGTVDGHLVGMNTGDPAVDGWVTYGGNARRDGQPARVL